jgi:hypothetical protein
VVFVDHQFHLNPSRGWLASLTHKRRRRRRREESGRVQVIGVELEVGRDGQREDSLSEAGDGKEQLEEGVDVARAAHVAKA